MKTVTYIAIGVVAGSLPLCTAFSSAVRADSLHDAVQYAVTTHPDVKEAAANRRARQAELREARGLYYPRVDVSGGYGPEWSENLTNPKGKTLMRTESEVNLTQLLFDGYARDGEVERRASSVDSASYRVLERSEVIALNSTQAYLDVLRNQELVQLAKDNVDVHRGIADQVAERVKGGQSGIGDQQQAGARLATAEDTLIRSEKDLQDAIAGFIRIIGEPPSGLTLPELKEDMLPANMEAAVSRALVNNPSVKAVAADIDTAHGERRAVEGDFYPTIRFEARGTANHNLDGIVGNNHDFQAMLRLKYALYKGGQDVARRTKAVEQITEAREHFLGVQRTIEEQSRLSWIATEHAQRESVKLNDLVLANSQVVSTYRQEFEIGQRDLLDLLDSENELFLARSRLINADYTALFGKYRILSDTGDLLAALDLKTLEETGTGFREEAGVKPDWQGEKGLTK